MPRIIANNLVRNQFLGSLKQETTSKAKMDFSRISSTHQRPDTFLSNSESTLNKNSARQDIPQYKNMFVKGIFSKEVDSPSFSISKDTLIQLQDTSSENTTKAQEINKSDLLPLESIETKKLAAPFSTDFKAENSISNERRSSDPLPRLKFENTEKNSKLNMTSTVSKVEMIGHEFAPETLMFSESLQKTADKYGVVIGLRSPSELGQIHLKEGHPTKNFHVKAKSSSTGPTAGFIAEKAKYSKMPSSQWEKQEGYIKEALNKGSELLDLSLSQVQIDNALDNGAMTKIKDNLFVAIYHDEKVVFSIEPPDNIVRELDGSPVKVLTNPPESDGFKSIQKAITADYDLFCIAPKVNQNVNLRPLIVGNKVIKFTQMKKAETISGRVNEYMRSGGALGFRRAQDIFVQGKGDPKGLDTDKGNLHYFANVIINDINKNVNEEGFKGGKLVWHGEEIANPYSGGFDPADKPIFFIPKQSPQQVETKEELRALFSELRGAGFAPDRNLRFNV